MYYSYAHLLQSINGPTCICQAVNTWSAGEERGTGRPRSPICNMFGIFTIVGLCVCVSFSWDLQPLDSNECPFAPCVFQHVSGFSIFVRFQFYRVSSSSHSEDPSLFFLCLSLKQTQSACSGAQVKTWIIDRCVLLNFDRFVFKMIFYHLIPSHLPASQVAGAIDPLWLSQKKPLKLCYATSPPALCL